MVVCTSTGMSFNRYGLYLASRIASSAAFCNISGPLTTCRLSITPALEITASTTTVPCTPAARAIGGYTGRIGASSIPSDNPDEILSGPA